MTTQNANTWTPEKLLKTSGAYWNACTIHAAIRLDIFSKLYEQPLNSAELAKQCACDVRGTELLLTALAGMGFVHKNAETSVALTDCARRYLCRQSPEYMGYILLHEADCVPAWQRLHEAVKTGRPYQNLVSEHTEQEREHFLLGMHNFASTHAGETVKKISLQGKEHLLDLGGATGTYALHFCEQNASLRVTLFDLPTSEVFAQKVIAEHNMQERIHFVGGNFMHDALPTGCDVVWISHILHSFSPKQCKALLKRVWENMPSGAMLYIQEFFLDDTHDGPEFAGLFGLNMLVATEGGQTYSFKDIGILLEELGAVDITRMYLNLPADADIIHAQKP